MTPGMTDAPPFTPEQLERMRTIGLTIDRAGRLWHDNAEVTHPRLRQALLRWLDVSGDGRDIIRLDDQRYAYVTVEDAHLRARTARWDGDRCFVTWDDDQEAELDYGSLRQAADNALYVQVRGKLRGRVGTTGYQALADHIVETADGFALAAAGQRWPIAH